jgi:hypothetical protein
LCIATGAKEAANRIAKEKKLSRDEKLAVLTEENVKLQIKHLKSLALIRNMHAKGSLPRIHGWLYRVETGTIDVLIDGRDDGPAKRSAKKQPAAKRRKYRSLGRAMRHAAGSLVSAGEPADTSGAGYQERLFLSLALPSGGFDHEALCHARGGCRGCRDGPLIRPAARSARAAASADHAFVSQLFGQPLKPRQLSPADAGVE